VERGALTCASCNRMWTLARSHIHTHTHTHTNSLHNAMHRAHKRRVLFQGQAKGLLLTTSSATCPPATLICYVANLVLSRQKPLTLQMLVRWLALGGWLNIKSKRHYRALLTFYGWLIILTEDKPSGRKPESGRFRNEIPAAELSYLYVWVICTICVSDVYNMCEWCVQLNDECTDTCAAIRSENVYVRSHNNNKCCKCAYAIGRLCFSRSTWSL